MTTAPFDARLLVGERMLWTGAPVQGVQFRTIDWLLIPFSIMWGGFALFWESAALGIGVLGATSGQAVGAVGLIFPLWGIPFVAVGLFLMVGRFFVDAWLRSGVSYALTEGRALIIRSKGPGSGFQSHALTSDLRLSQGGKDGRGTISFGAQPMFGFGLMRAGGFGIWLPALSSQPEFFQISDASTVYDLAQRQAAQRR